MSIFPPSPTCFADLSALWFPRKKLPGKLTDKKHARFNRIHRADAASVGSRKKGLYSRYHLDRCSNSFLGKSFLCNQSKAAEPRHFPQGHIFFGREAIVERGGCKGVVSRRRTCYSKVFVVLIGSGEFLFCKVILWIRSHFLRLDSVQKHEELSSSAFSRTGYCHRSNIR